jgi:hypothetical protein
MAKDMVTKRDLLEVLEGCEISSVRYEGAVAVSGGKIWKNGAVIVPAPSRQELSDLFAEYYEQELGGSGL